MPRRKLPPQDPLSDLYGALPERIPVLAIRSTVIFPVNATAIQVGFPPNIEVLNQYTEKNLVVAVVPVEDEEMPVNPASIEKVAVAARVLSRLNLPGGTIQTAIQGMIRVRLENARLEDGCYTAFPRLVQESPLEDEAAARLVDEILTTVGSVAARVERLEDVPRILRKNLGDPGRFADLVATLAHFNVAEKDQVLQRLEIGDRLQYVLERLQKEWNRVQELEEPSPTGAEISVARRGAGDRTRSIRKRIQRLQAELGELDPGEKEALDLLRRVDHAQLPSRIASAARREAERLRMITPSASEAAEIRNYLEVVLDVPWVMETEGVGIDLDAVELEMSRKHVGLDDVKRRILEILSVATLRGNVRGMIPCIVGPPGVGKRSLAAAVARGLGRPLVRVELGGRGEADLVGKRRSNPDSRAGKLIGAFIEAGVRDPVFLLEELDEIGLGKVDGDPVGALEEFLNPEARAEFTDQYLDLPFDLSDSILIATAQDFYRIPRNLREFLVEIRIAGYTPEEKAIIAREQLLPQLIERHGLATDEIGIADDMLLFLARGYARDSGVGNLRRSLAAILRFVAHQKASGTAAYWQLDQDTIEEVLGVPRYSSTAAESSPEIGVVTGLAWTASGGELMFIEALKMPGTGRLIITGLLGEVMRESVSAAYSYVRSRSDMLGIPNGVFGEHDLHIHFPVGATPKDGPSAGAAVTLAIASSLSGKPVRHDIAMTGEVTLRGKILEIGGVKEKTLAAYRAGLREMILPSGNGRDLRDVPEDVREGITFHFVDRMEQILVLALTDRAPASERRRRRTGGLETGSRAAS